MPHTCVPMILSQSPSCTQLLIPLITSPTYNQVKSLSYGQSHTLHFTMVGFFLSLKKGSLHPVKTGAGQWEVISTSMKLVLFGVEASKAGARPSEAAIIAALATAVGVQCTWTDNDMFKVELLWNKYQPIGSLFPTPSSWFPKKGLRDDNHTVNSLTADNFCTF